MACLQWVSMSQADALTGGPDSYGMRFIDSTEGGGPVYFFEDISTTGTGVALSDDQMSGAIPLGFTFNFYGADYTEVYISSNGFLSVLSGQSNGCCTGQPLPAIDATNGTISAWWGDLYPGGAPGGIGVRHQTLGTAPSRRFIVQFTNVPHCCSLYPTNAAGTFQFKLFESSNLIEIHYDTALANANPRNYSAGIEDTTGTIGLQYYLSTGSLATPLAVRYFGDDLQTNGPVFAAAGPTGGPFTPESNTYTLSNAGGSALDWTAAKSAAWLNDPLPATGTLTGGASTTVDVSLNLSAANALSPGTYTDTVDITNETSGFVWPVPVRLDVYAYPQVTVEQAVGQPDPTGATAIYFEVQFSEAVTGFDDNTLPDGDVAFVGTAAVDAYNILPYGEQAPTSIDYEILNTCNSSDEYTFQLNGGVLGTTTSNPSGSCTCTPPLQTYTVSDAGLIASFWLPGQANEFRVSKMGVSTLFAWARAQLHFDSGTQMLPIYDFGGGDCTLPDLCAAGYSGNEFDESVFPTYGDPSRYTFEVTAVSSEGTVVPVVRAGAAQSVHGIGNTVSTSTDNSVYYDLLPPTVTTIFPAGAYQTNHDQVDFTVVFSEDITGLDESDFAVHAVGPVGASVLYVEPGTGSVRNVTVSTGAGDGTLRLDLIDDDTVVDGLGRPLGGPGLVNGDFTAGDSYLIDRTPPTGSIVLNSGAQYANSRVVTATLAADDGVGSGVSEMDFSFDPFFPGTWTSDLRGWPPYQTEVSEDLNLLPGVWPNDGVHTAYVRFRDLAGNVSTEVVSDDITLDTTPPTGSVAISGGASWTNTVSVTLTPSAADGASGVSDMQFSNDGISWSGWEAYATTREWALDPGDGLKTVHARYRDALGNASTNEISATVTLDTVEPAFTELAADPGEASEDDVVFLTFNVSEVLVAAPEVTVNGHPAALSPGKAGYTFHYTVLGSADDPLGPAYIEISGVDQAGNLGAAGSVSVLTITALTEVPAAGLAGLATLAASLALVCGMALAGLSRLRRHR